MRGTALSLGFAIGALALACELDTAPSSHPEGIGRLDGAVDAAAVEAGNGERDAGEADSGAQPPPEDGGSTRDAGPCDAACDEDAPVCLAEGRCVECAADSDCRDPARPACDTGEHACVPCLRDEHCSDPAAPHCDAAEQTCAACVEDAHCSDPAAPRCDPATRQCAACLGNDDCGDAAPVCDLDAKQCVQCLSDEHCSDPKAPQCEDRTCVPCTSSDACAGRERTLCDLAAGSPTAGSCVQCTTADETPCGGTVCDPQARTCTDRPLASKHTCEPCIADSECVADHRCIELQFAGAVRPSAYCMKQLASGCARPYMSAPLRRPSRSGAAAEDYCGIDEQHATCEAIDGLIDGVQCPGGADEECGREGSLCRTVNGGANFCSYACEASAQCPAAFPCGSGYCGG